MRASLHVIVLLALLAGCDELPAYDDPREVPGAPDAREPGECNGVSVRCGNRPANRCAGGGCEPVMSCQAVSRQRCLSHDNADLCESDPDCFWIVDGCEERFSGGCGVNQSQTGCSQAGADCVWAPDCDGITSYCFEETTPEGCSAIPGCDWQ